MADGHRSRPHAAAIGLVLAAIPALTAAARAADYCVSHTNGVEGFGLMHIEPLNAHRLQHARAPVRLFEEAIDIHVDYTSG